MRRSPSTRRPSYTLDRFFGNLVDNAIRYVDAECVRLSLDDSYAVVTMEDDGPGIPQACLAALTEPFVRGEDSRSADTGGAGLGIFIARAIVVSAHGGDVVPKNLTGSGIRVSVRLPAVTAG